MGKKSQNHEKLARRSSAELAANAFASSRGHLTKGGWTKVSGLDEPVTRLVRLNAAEDDKNR